MREAPPAPSVLVRPTGDGKPGGARPSAARARRRELVALVGLLAVQLVLCVASVRDETATYDESQHLRYGMQVLDGRTERFDDSKMPVSAVNAALARALGHRDPEALATIQAARLATVGAGLALTLVVALRARSLYGPAAGLLAAGLTALDPNLIAHARLVTTDVAAALGITLALACASRYAERPGPGRAVVTGLAVGAAQLCKFTSVVLYPLLLAAAAVAAAASARRRSTSDGAPPGAGRPPRAIAGDAAAALLASLVVLNAGYLFQGTGDSLSTYRFRTASLGRLQERGGALGRIPLPVPRAWLEGLDWVRHLERTGESYGRITLFGELRRGQGFPGYFLVVGFFKTPIGTQVLLGAAALTLVRSWQRRPLAPGEWLLVVPLAFFAVYFNFLFRAQIGLRLALVGYPLAYVLAGALLAGGWRAVSRGRRLLVASAGTATAASVLAFYPHYISYVNEVLPDRNQAFRIFADSSLDYGQSDGYFARYRAEHPDVVFEPKEPVAGTIAARVNWLAGISEREHDTWLGRHFDPVGHVARSYLLFRVSEEEAARLRAERGSPAR